MWPRTIIEKGEVKETYGVFVYRLHAVATAFPEFAEAFVELLLKVPLCL